MNAEEVITMAKDYAMIRVSGLHKLHGLAASIKADGAVVQCGVCQGGSAAVLWHAVGTERKLWLFDSFQGMPYPTEKDGGRAYSKYNHRMEAYGHWNKGDVMVVTDLIQKVGPLKNVQIIQGWVENTLPDNVADIGPIALLHLDMDFYSPTMCALEYLNPLMSPGGLVLIDDYHAWQGCRTAVDEYISRHEIKFDRENALWWVNR